MFKTIPFEEQHVLALVEQPMNAHVRELYRTGLSKSLEGPSSVTGVVDGKNMVCGGVVELWDGRGVVWTVFNEESRHCFVPVFRGIRAFLADQLKNYRRLEIAVPAGFEIGHRRAKLLGFKVECELARKYLPNGDDCVLYSMVRE